MQSEAKSCINVAAGLLMSIAVTAEAATHLVNPEGTGDFPTIQDAVDAAVDGDVIQLADGVYPYLPGNIGVRLHGKEITVESLSGNVEACVLDGLDQADWAAFQMSDGEGPGCVIRGITIRRFGDGKSTGGGFGIYYDSSPTIENCRVLECYQQLGGGFAIGGNSSPRFTRCLFMGNRAEVHSGGGSVNGSGHVIFEECLFAGNQARLGLAGGVGVGSDATVTMIECTIAGNGTGSGNANPQLGGGLWVYGDAFLTRSILWGNCNREALMGSGGSLSFDCCVVDSSGVVNDGGLVTYSGDNWFTDPLFCDPVPCDTGPPTILGDYQMDAASPALLAPCGPIGVFGEGCTTVSIEPSSWGQIKGIYRLED